MMPKPKAYEGKYELHCAYIDSRQFDEAAAGIGHNCELIKLTKALTPSKVRRYFKTVGMYEKK